MAKRKRVTYKTKDGKNTFIKPKKEVHNHYSFGTELINPLITWIFGIGTLIISMEELIGFLEKITELNLLGFVIVLFLTFVIVTSCLCIMKSLNQMGRNCRW